MSAVRLNGNDDDDNDVKPRKRMKPLSYIVCLVCSYRLLLSFSKKKNQISPLSISFIIPFFRAKHISEKGLHPNADQRKRNIYTGI